MKKIFNLVFIILLLLIISCQQGTKKTSEAEATKANVEEYAEEQLNTAYKIPSPVELFMFLRDMEIQFNKEAVNSVENIAKYYTNSSKAINFGIYASDLAYCTVFGMHQETFLYFSTTRTLATDLGFTSGFDEVAVNRINSNLYNSDSLFQITNDSYADACNYLEETGNRDMLALILAGSWIEGLHIMINSIPEFNPEDPVLERIADQRYLLDNLIEYYKTVDNNISTDKVLDKLFDLQSSFDLLYDNPSDILITKGQYDEIVQKIGTMRKELIS